MLRIESLLNQPSVTSHLRNIPSASPPLTPAPSAPNSPPRSALDGPSAFSTSMLATRPQKLPKDAAIFVPGKPKAEVLYPPFECNEDSICLSAADKIELARQHKAFSVFPRGEGNGGCIGHYVRHIPYSSEKKNFFGKTGRDAFDVFQYRFKLPEDDKTEYYVMWDYHVGLVRITPFFKACKFSKTTPAKALATNTGLKDLSHSITGGALAAQGYWLPYACARAICLTFCYSIRWALTPVFGPSFVKECLPRHHPGFEKFKIEPDVVRCAALEAEGWKTGGGSRSVTPERPGVKKTDDARPRLEALEPNAGGGTSPKKLRPRPFKGTFKTGSPFDDGSTDGSELPDHSDYENSDSPAVSPKTVKRAPPPMNSFGWASINRLTPSPTMGSIPLSNHSLIAQPRAQHPALWRAGEVKWEAQQRSDDSKSPTPTSSSEFPVTVKRRERAASCDGVEEDIDDSDPTSAKGYVCGQEGNTTADRARKRVKVQAEPALAPHTAAAQVLDRKTRALDGKSARLTVADFKTAQILVNLKLADETPAE